MTKHKSNKSNPNRGLLGIIMTTVLYGLVQILPCSVALAVDTSLLPKNILIFGGNGFMGSSTAERLIKAGHRLTLLNRGTWYWDTGFYVKPHVDLIKCDRMQPLSRCSGLTDFVYSSGKIDAVIDFSAYHPQHMTDALEALGSSVGLYVFISSDSVYEVCVKNHTEASKESDAVRPESEEERQQLSARDSYGNRKLQCEEILEEQRKKGGPPYVSLRLPDVFGPRDNTYRMWIYQLWMKLRPYLDKDVTIPADLATQPISLVYVSDVADIIVHLVEGVPRDAMDQAFNLAQAESLSLMDVLHDIRDELKLTDVINVSTSDTPDTIKLLPSVKLGPVDTSKVERVLNWQPTEWKKAVKETVAFYEQAIKTPVFDKARRDIIQTMQSWFTSKPYNVIRGLRDIYGLAYPEERDEL